MANMIKHKERRAALRRVENQVIEPGTVRFAVDELRKAQIVMVPAAFSPYNETDFNPPFFHPYPTDMLIRPEVDWVPYGFPKFQIPSEDKWDTTIIDNARALWYYLESYLGGYQTAGCDSGWCYQDIGEYGFKKPLWEFNSYRAGSQRDWRVHSVYHHHNTSWPHLMCTMIYDVEGDNATLLRGELLALIRIMRGRLRSKGFIEHDTAPVLLFSILGHHIRILQGHFNGNELVVHCSKLYDFQNEQEAPIDVLAQWFFSDPIGQTMPPPPRATSSGVE